MTSEELQTLTVSCRLRGTSLVDELRIIEASHRTAFQRVSSAYNELRSDAIKSGYGED